MRNLSLPETIFVRRVAVATVVAMLATVLTVFVSSEVYAATVTESEPNNNSATADVVPLGATVSGAGATQVKFQYSDYDFYAFDVPSAGRAKFTFTFPAGLGTGTLYNFTVTDETDTTLFRYDLEGVDSNGARLAEQALYLPAGRFYVEIDTDSRTASWGKSYALRLDVTPGTVETEFNNSTSTADVVGLGSTISGSGATQVKFQYSDYDFFAFDVPSAGRAKFTFTYPAGLGTGTLYDFTVSDANGSTLFHYYLGGADSDGSRLNSQALYVPAGRLYVKIDTDSRTASWGKAYALRLDVTPGNVETELNDSTATADLVDLGSTISGSGATESRLQSADHDYYAYNVPVAVTAKLRFTFPSNLGSGVLYYLRVYNAAGAQLYSYAVQALDNSSEGLSVSLPAGYAYIEVHTSKTSASWGVPYTLSLGMSLTATPQPGISGSPMLGSLLTAVPGSWDPSPVSFAYQWLRAGDAIPGATASTYRVVDADVDAVLSVRVTGSKSGHTPVSMTSAAVLARDVNSFLDVTRVSGSPSFSQFWTEIRWFSTAGISTGYVVPGGKEYRPVAPVARDAMAAFLYRYAGSPAFTPPTVSPFADVSTTSQFYKEITWLASTGISTGWDVGGGRTEFRPLQSISRDAMAAFLYRYSKSPSYTPPAASPFVDVPMPSQFYKEITWLASRGITTGYPDGGFHPLGTVNRDAMAAFLYRNGH